jgi:hypothetical protein
MKAILQEIDLFPVGNALLSITVLKYVTAEFIIFVMIIFIIISCTIITTLSST